MAEIHKTSEEDLAYQKEEIKRVRDRLLVLQEERRQAALAAAAKKKQPLKKGQQVTQQNLAAEEEQPKGEESLPAILRAPEQK